MPKKSPKKSAQTAARTRAGTRAPAKKTGKPSRKQSRPRRPENEVYTLSSLEQVKVLADPLRIRLLEAFCQERTTKQVATLIGEKPTKLYHHVEALERVGLIRLSRKRQVRGTVEKYYMAVARLFRADNRLFEASDSESGERDTLQGMVSAVLNRTSAAGEELLRR
jgi:DNA-binding transcriptional ArsR family regulator